MSTIGVDNIKPAAGGTAFSTRGVAKAWVNYSGTTTTVADSQNVASLTDNGSGNHTVNFTNSFDSSNYVPATGGRYSASYHGLVTVGDRAVSSVALFGMTGNSSGTYLGASFKADLELVAASIHGDLA